MRVQVSASVVLDQPRPVVRRYLISRWVDPDKEGKVVGRVFAGADEGPTATTGRARDVLPAFEVATSREEERSSPTSRQAFEVEVYGVLWRYELEARGPQQTGLHMVYVQAGFMARVPGMRMLMTRAMERETNRLRRWAADTA